MPLAPLSSLHTAKLLLPCLLHVHKVNKGTSLTTSHHRSKAKQNRPALLLLPTIPTLLPLHKPTSPQRLTPPPLTLLHQLDQQLLQLPNLALQLLNLQHRRIKLDIRLGVLNLLIPPIGLEITLVKHLLPLVRDILIRLASLTVVPNNPRLALLDERSNDEERRVEDGHDAVVEVVVALLVHPPLEGEDEEEHLDEVEGGDEDVFVGGADELHGLLGEEGHVFVRGVAGDVLVGRVVEGDEDVEQDYHDDEGKDVVEDEAEGGLLSLVSSWTGHG